MVDKREHDYIVTFTGLRFTPLHPRTIDVCVEDIAHHLSNVGRFSGATRAMMTVAEHSVRVSAACPEFPLEGLFHDAAEAYIADLSAPVKHADHPLGDAYRDVERGIEITVARALGLRYPWPEEVHRADVAVRHTEARDLMHQNYPQGSPVMAYSLKTPWTPVQAEREFLKRYRELMFDREGR